MLLWHAQVFHFFESFSFREGFNPFERMGYSVGRNFYCEANSAIFQKY